MSTYNNISNQIRDYETTTNSSLFQSVPNKYELKRLARRGGVKRISSLVYEETRALLKQFIEDVMHDATIYTESASRKTVTVLDIAYALKRKGTTLYC